jgi:hypothetical protein
MEQKFIDRRVHNAELAAGEERLQQNSIDRRVHRMYSTDRFWAVGAVGVLWLTYLFVFYETYTVGQADNIVLTLAVSGGLVLLFNSASIFAMVDHFAEDKDQIYGLDIHYLDEMKKAKR